MADDFAERYGDLLTGSYDCVDRVVLNAFFPLGHDPGGFRCWWRRWHDGSDDQLDDTHLMRMAGRFASAWTWPSRPAAGSATATPSTRPNTAVTCCSAPAAM